MTWSFVLGAVGIVGLAVAAHRPRIGWRINIGAQALWLVYAVVTRQWGFLPMSVAYAVMYMRLLRRAPSRAQAPADQQLAGPAEIGAHN